MSEVGLYPNPAHGLSQQWLQTVQHQIVIRPSHTDRYCNVFCVFCAAYVYLSRCNFGGL